MSTLPQRRAKAALAAIRDYAEKAPEKERLAYATYVKSLPAAIVMNGLGQALATELAQGGKDSARGQGGRAPNAHRQLYLHLEDWLCGTDTDAPFRGRRDGQPKDEPVLMLALCDTDQHGFLLAQAESMAYIQWLKKFANAFLTEGNGA